MSFLLKLIYWILPNRNKDNFKNIPKTGGAFKDKPDSRDYKIKIAGASLSDYPSKYSLKNNGLTRIENQGIYNSCVAHAITSSIETFSKNNGFPYYLELSRMYLWHYARKLSGTYPKNEGCYIRDGWKAAKDLNMGVTIEKLYPYTSKSYNKEPGLAAKIFRKFHTPFNYYFIIGNKTQKEIKIKRAIHDLKVEVVFGIGLTRSFMRPNKYSVYKPNEKEKVEFYHAMTLIGWDDEKKAFILRNSWGPTWGKVGLLYVDKDWILNNAYSISYPLLQK